MAEHSKMLSPSASGRWLRCPGSSSKLLELDIKPSTSEAAERGTMMHEAAESLFLGFTTGKPASLSDDEWHLVKVAVEWANEYIDGLDDADVTVFTEHQVKFNGEFEDCFGTADIVGYSPRLEQVFILDYKFGYGEVPALGNSQLKIYAIAAMEQHAEWNAESVEMGILQPKINDAIDLYELDTNTLFEWRDDILFPKMRTVLAGDGKIIAGPHCEKYFCPARGRCAAQAQDSMDFMSHLLEGDKAPTTDELKDDMSDFFIPEEEIGPMYDKIETAKAFIKSFEGMIMDRLKNGAKVVCHDGPMKLVRGKSNRKWANQEEAEKYMRNQGLSKVMYDKKFCSPAQAEKLMHDKMKDNERVKNNFYSMIVKGEGKLSFARATDKRAAVEWEEPVLDIVDVDDINLF